jgi:hypothetical protein
MRFGGKILRASAASVLLVVAAAGTWIFANSQPGEARFCQASLAIFEIDGRTVVPQDQTGLGEDERCDFDQTKDGYPVLGFDCKVREPDGEVTVELVPNRSDGTCGLPGPDDEPLPDPWPKR